MAISKKIMDYRVSEAQIVSNSFLSMNLQILLLEDPNGVHATTETKETPLFFAVRNDFMDCAELLLQWGANSEVLNLRFENLYPFNLAHHRCHFLSKPL